MDVEGLYAALGKAQKISDVDALLEVFEQQNDVKWVPLGGWDRKNNRGTVEVSADPGRALVERITNGIDGYIERKHFEHGGQPICHTPREAASAWMAVPPEGLSSLSSAARRDLAKNIQVTLREGDGKEKRLLEIRDLGIGMLPDELPDTILSLNSDNKWQKHYLVGTYGQGGSSTLAASAYTFIASKKVGSDRVGFTVAKFQDLPADEYKSGNYAYLTLDETVPEVLDSDFTEGTLVRHFGYDLSGYTSPLGPRSVYGLLNTILFDPLVPIWLSAEEVFSYGRRVIKGARNALNGAVDEGDEDSKGPSLSHRVPMYFVTLAEHGQLGLEYWLLEPPDGSDKRKKIPIASYVNDKRPVILTINGQNQADLVNSVIRKDADLLYLVKRLVVHVSCDRLTPEAKRALFVSNREEARSGRVLNAIRDEVVKSLRSDSDLERLNLEAREKAIGDQEETSEAETKKEVARLLKIQGVPVTTGDIAGTRASGNDREHPSATRRAQGTPKSIEVQEPPTFVRLLWDKDSISLYPGQRRYLRVETDAGPQYHNPENLEASRTNFFLREPGNISICGSTPIRNGRFRVIIEADESAQLDETNSVTVELRRAGLPSLSDSREIAVIDRPPSAKRSQSLNIPPFEFHDVSGPEDEKWTLLEWPEEIESVAFSTEVEGGKLSIYYSTAFPRFSKTHSGFTRSSEAKGRLFLSRYKIWLLVYSLLEMNDIETESRDASDDEQTVALEERMRSTFCRIAKMATLFASQEVTTQVSVSVE